MITTLLQIILSFGKIGIISLGGGNSMLKLLEYEAVGYRHWVGNEEFIGMLGTSFLFPGLTAVKLSALIGYKAGGLLGSTLAVICLNLPGLVMAILGYHWLASHNGPTTRKVMIAVQYGALALLAAATFSVAQGVVDMYFSIAIAMVSILFFIGLAFFNVSPFYGFLGFIAACFFLVR
jgi:chromate transporter